MDDETYNLMLIVITAFCFGILAYIAEGAGAAFWVIVGLIVGIHLRRDFMK